MYHPKKSKDMRRCDERRAAENVNIFLFHPNGDTSSSFGMRQKYYQNIPPKCKKTTAKGASMNYFNSVKSFDDLKSQYRALAFQHHPDRGGSVSVMQSINAEYDSLYHIWNTYKASDQGYESAHKYRASFYEEQGWKGVNYSSELRVKDIAVLFRAYVKKHWPQCRFSVTSDYNSIDISLVSAMFSPWADLENPEVALEIERRKQENPWYDAEATINSGNMQVNHYSVDGILLLSPVSKVMFKDICAFLQSYNFDYSDSQTDYFHTNFYLNIAIGKWNKPFIQKGSMPMSESGEIKKAA